MHIYIGNGKEKRTDEVTSYFCVKCGRIALYDLSCPEERLLDAIFNLNPEKGKSRMKTLKVSVKSGGKVVGTLSVPQFGTYKEVQTYFKLEDSKLERCILRRFNRQFRQDCMNLQRVPKSLSTVVKRLAKTNSDFNAELEDLLKKYGTKQPE